MKAQVTKKLTTWQQIGVTFQRFYKNPNYEFWATLSRWNWRIKSAIENLQHKIDTTASKYMNEEDIRELLK